MVKTPVFQTDDISFILFHAVSYPLLLLTFILHLVAWCSIVLHTNTYKRPTENAKAN
jgi:hypothetical protein